MYNYLINMAQPNSIKILEVFNITPSSDSPDSAELTEFSLPLTFLDTFCFKFPPIQCLFFYPHTNSAQPIIPKLKHSLSQTLRHYLPIAGTLSWPPRSSKPHVRFKPGDAVSLTVAESDAAGDFFNRVVREASEFHRLVPSLNIDDRSASIVALQVTLFPGVGFIVGITGHHAFLDGKSVAMFMKSWAYVCKHEDRPLSPELTPFLDRTVVKDPTGLDALYLNRWMEKSSSGNSKTRPFDPWSESQTTPDLVRGTFELTRGEIENLKTRISQLDGTTLSSFVVASAYALTCMVKATSFEPAGDDNRKLYFIVGVDYRSRLNPPVPAGYFGNCAGSHVGQTRARDCFGEDGVAVVAAQIMCLLKGLSGGVMEGSAERLSRWGRLEAESTVVALTWSPKFGVYGADFGFGRPEKVEIVSIHRKAISLVESSVDHGMSGGIEIGVVLKKPEMGRFASLFRTNLAELLK